MPLLEMMEAKLSKLYLPIVNVLIIVRYAESMIVNRCGWLGHVASRCPATAGHQRASYLSLSGTPARKPLPSRSRS